MNRLCPGCGHVLGEDAWYDWSSKTWYCIKECKIKALQIKGEQHKQKFIKENVNKDKLFHQGGLF